LYIKISQLRLRAWKIERLIVFHAPVWLNCMASGMEDWIFKNFPCPGPSLCEQSPGSSANMTINMTINMNKPGKTQVSHFQDSFQLCCPESRTSVRLYCGHQMKENQWKRTLQAVTDKTWKRRTLLRIRKMNSGNTVKNLSGGRVSKP